MRKKPFDKCKFLFCERKTISGKKEKDPAKRICIFHTEEAIQRYIKYINTPRKKCRTFWEFKKCYVYNFKRPSVRIPNIPKNKCIELIKIEYILINCFDIDRKWKRIRCKTAMSGIRKCHQCKKLFKIQNDHPEVMQPNGQFPIHMCANCLKLNDDIKLQQNNPR